MINQCYDGAFVMSGKHGGMQKFVQQKLGRTIPYIHCFNHRLHLVVIAAIGNIQAPALFLGQIRMLYNFFSRLKVKQVYDETNISRLIETRWCGHKRAIDTFFLNYNEISAVLESIKSGKHHNLDGKDVATAIGISKAIKHLDFIYMLQFLKHLLDLIEPANKLLQLREFSYCEAMPVVNFVIKEVEKLRTMEKFNEMTSKAQQFIADFVPDSTQSTSSRVWRQSSLLTNFIVSETIGQRSENFTENSYFEVLDKMINEMKRRFTENSDILLALGTCDKMEMRFLNILSSIGLKFPDESEMKTAKAYVDSKKCEQDGVKFLNQSKRHFRTYIDYSVRSIHLDAVQQSMKRHFHA